MTANVASKGDRTVNFRGGSLVIIGIDDARAWRHLYFGESHGLPGEPGRLVSKNRPVPVLSKMCFARLRRETRRLALALAIRQGNPSQRLTSSATNRFQGNDDVRTPRHRLRKYQWDRLEKMSSLARTLFGYPFLAPNRWVGDRWGQQPFGWSGREVVLRPHRVGQRLQEEQARSAETRNQLLPELSICPP